MVEKNTAIPELMRSAGLLKTVKRTGWLRKAGITSDRESVADHSFRMAMVAALLGLERNLDSAKLMRMCLIHDLAEAVTGDRTPEEKKSFKAHRQEEDKVMRRILNKLPDESRSVLLNDWKELLESRTKEATLAWQIDKFEMALQAKDYMRVGYDKKKLLVFAEQRFDKPLMKLLKSY